MSLNTVKQMLREYELTRYKNERELKEKKEEIYDKVPNISEIREEIDKLSIENLKITLTDGINNDKYISNKNEILKLEDKFDNELKKYKYSKADFEIKYDCPNCKDTGYIGIEKCSCFKQKLIDKTFNFYNINRLKEENFDTFDIGYYSNKENKEFGISSKSNINKIKKECENFCENFDFLNTKSLLFTGDTGLGKTFLSNCVAERLLKKQKTIIYQTVPMLMDLINMSKYNQERINEYEKVFNCDLLILDDLGTETLTNAKNTELFNIINTRILNDKKMIISSNLSLTEIFETYGERISSRIVGNFVTCRFFGEDIRLLKKKIGGKK